MKMYIAIIFIPRVSGKTNSTRTKETISSHKKLDEAQLLKFRILWEFFSGWIDSRSWNQYRIFLTLFDSHVMQFVGEIIGHAFLV